MVLEERRRTWIGECICNCLDNIFETPEFGIHTLHAWFCSLICFCWHRRRYRITISKKHIVRNGPMFFWWRQPKQKQKILSDNVDVNAACLLTVCYATGIGTPAFDETVCLLKSRAKEYYGCWILGIKWRGFFGCQWLFTLSLRFEHPRCRSQYHAFFSWLYSQMCKLLWRKKISRPWIRQRLAGSSFRCSGHTVQVEKTRSVRSYITHANPSDLNLPGIQSTISSDCIFFWHPYRGSTWYTRGVCTVLKVRIVVINPLRMGHARTSNIRNVATGDKDVKRYQE